MAISASGLGGTIDVNSIVTQLMALERKPELVVQAKIRENNNRISVYGRIGSELSSLESAARGLSGVGGLSAMAATSSNPAAVAATASSTAPAGQYEVIVNSLSKPQRLASVAVASSTDEFGRGRVVIRNSAGASFSVDVRGKNASGALVENTNLFTSILSGGLGLPNPGPADVQTSGAGLQDIADAINSTAENFGVQASVVNDGTGFRLLLSPEASGTANAISVEVTDGDGNSTDASGLSRLRYDVTAKRMTQTQAASDTSVTIDGLTVTSSNNVVTDAIPGVTLKLLSTGSSTITVDRDDAALAERAQAFVDAYNQFVTNNAARYGKGGDLEADGSLFSMMTRMASLVGSTGGSEGSEFRYLFQIGISVQAKGGRLSFDAGTFRAALAKDPDGVAALMGVDGDGVMKQIAELAARYQGTDGIVELRQKGFESNNRVLNDRIDALERRLTAVEARLRQQYSTLDALLGRMSQTSSALSQQLRSIS